MAVCDRIMVSPVMKSALRDTISPLDSKTSECRFPSLIRHRLGQLGSWRGAKRNVRLKGECGTNTERPRNAKSPTGEGWAFLYSGSPTWTRTRDLRINRTGHRLPSLDLSFRFARGFSPLLLPALWLLNVYRTIAKRLGRYKLLSRCKSNN